MTELYYPNLVYNTGDVTDVEYEKFSTAALTRDGVVGLPTDSSVVFGDTSGRQVKFRANIPVVVRGGQWLADATVTKSIAANTSGSTRTDLLTIRLDRSAVTAPAAAAHVITGTPGSGAPSPTQNAAGSGVYDFPLGTVTVANGVSTINAADVHPTAYYLGEAIYLCTSTTRPPHRFGRRIKQSPDGTEYVSDGTNWILQREDTGTVNFAGPGVGIATGWTAQLHSQRRINGVVYVSLQLTRTGVNLPVNTDTDVATLTGGMWPDNQYNVLVYNLRAKGNLRAVVSTAGKISLTDYGSPINTGDILTFQAMSWPAA